MTVTPITADALRRDVLAVLAGHGMSLEQFVDADLDDLDDAELRDLWLMTRDALVAVA